MRDSYKTYDTYIRTEQPPNSYTDFSQLFYNV